MKLKEDSSHNEVSSIFRPVSVPVTDRWHSELSEKSAWYRNWHNKAEQPLAHWATLGIVFLIVFTIFSVRNNTYNAAAAERSDSEFQNRWTYNEAEMKEKKGALVDLTTAYNKGNAATKQTLATQMKTIACERYVLLKLAVNENPKAVLRNAISDSDRAKLPAEVLPCVEDRVSGEKGDYSWAIVDGLGSTSERFSLKSDAGSRQLIITNDASRPQALSGDEISVSGVLVGDRIVVNDNSSATKLIESNSNASAAGDRKVAVIMFDFLNSGTNMAFIATSTLRDRIFGSSNSVADFFDEMTYGQTTLSGHLNGAAGDFFGHYRINENYIPGTFGGADTCSPEVWGAQAEQIAAGDGFVRSNYDHVIWVIPGVCTNWHGIASLGGYWSMVDNPSAPVIAHELGHNLGRLHANMLRCTDAAGAPVAVSNTCFNGGPYFDVMDVMGGGGGQYMTHMNAHHKTNGNPGTNWLQPSNTMTLLPGTNPDGTYTIVPAHLQDGLKSLRIPKVLNINGSEKNGYYYLDFRQPVGYDGAPGIQTTYPNFYNGVTIRFGAPALNEWEITNTNVIDTTPATISNIQDAPLLPGQTFTDSALGLTIRTESVTPAGATVRVTFNGEQSCTNVAPTMTYDNSSPFESPAGVPFSLKFSIRNNDPINCPPSTYNFSYSYLPSFWGSIPFTQAITIPAGTTEIVSSTISTPPGSQSEVWQLTAKAVHQGEPSFTVERQIQHLITPPCPFRNPSVTVSPASTQSLGGVAHTYSVNVKNNDLPSCSPSGSYLFTMGNLPSGWTMTTTSTSPVITLQAGASSTRQYTITAPEGYATGTYSTVVSARRSGYWYNTIFGTSSINHTVLPAPTSVQGPIANVMSPLNGSTFTSGSAKRLTFKTSAEVVGGFIGSIEIKLDGTTVHTCNLMQPSYAECSASYPLGLISVGQHTVTAVATEFPTNQTNSYSIQFTKTDSRATGDGGAQPPR